MGPKIWISLPEDVKDLTSSKMYRVHYCKGWYGHECRCNIASTRATHITILELLTLAWLCPSGNLTPNINKQNINCNETLVFRSVFGVYSPTRVYFCSFFSSFFSLGFDPFNNGFYCTKFDFPFSSCKYLDFVFVSEDKWRINEKKSAF